MYVIVVYVTTKLNLLSNNKNALIDCNNFQKKAVK